MVAENITKQGEKNSLHPGWLKQHERPGVISRGLAATMLSPYLGTAEQCARPTRNLLLGERSFLRAQELPSAHLGDTFLCTDCDHTHCFCKVGQGLLSLCPLYPIPLAWQRCCVCACFKWRLLLSLLAENSQGKQWTPCMLMTKLLEGGTVFLLLGPRPGGPFSMSCRCTPVWIAGSW